MLLLFPLSIATLFKLSRMEQVVKLLFQSSGTCVTCSGHKEYLDISVTTTASTEAKRHSALSTAQLLLLKEFSISQEQR